MPCSVAMYRADTASGRARPNRAGRKPAMGPFDVTVVDHLRVFKTPAASIIATTLSVVAALEAVASHDRAW